MKIVAYQSVLVCAIFGLVFGGLWGGLAAAEPIKSGLILRGRVAQVDTGDGVVSSAGEMETQLVTVEVGSGPLQGLVVTITNTLTGHPYYDLSVKPGDPVLLQTDVIDG